MFTRNIWQVKSNLMAGQLCPTGPTLSSDGSILSISNSLILYLSEAWASSEIRSTKRVSSKLQVIQTDHHLDGWICVLNFIAIHPLDISPKTKNVNLMVA